MTEKTEWKVKETMRANDDGSSELISTEVWAGDNRVALVDLDELAPLIAAAPDLLQVAKDFLILEVETCDCDICKRWVSRLQAAVAKASTSQS